MTQDWVKKKLGDICTIELGKTPSRSQKAYWDPDKKTGNVWLSIADLLNVDGDIVSDSKEYVSDKGAALCKTVSAGSLLVSFKLTLGRLAFAGKDLITNEAIAALTIRDEGSLSKHFLYYYLDHFDWVRAAEGDIKIKGMTLNKEKLKELDVAFPKRLSEQKRIVTILDEAFEGIAAATANAEKNLSNAREVFESYLQTVYKHHATEWQPVTLDSLLENGIIQGHLDGNHGGDYPRKEEFIQEGVPYISANCLTDDRIDFSRAKYLSPARAAMLRKGFAKNNDVLFAHNATVGPVAILHTDEDHVILGTSLTYYRCNQKHIMPEYLAHYMRSFEFKRQYLQVMRQSTRNQVPITKQREFFFIVPPIDEQKKIVTTLDGLFDNGKELESIYQRKLSALTELKKSILHQAFTGQLH